MERECARDNEANMQMRLCRRRLRLGYGVGRRRHRGPLEEPRMKEQSLFAVVGVIVRVVAVVVILIVI